MNVKLGDAAIIIKGRWLNVGKIVYVARETPDRDYTHIGYGILPSWIVESLGGILDSENGPVWSGHIPDISLRRLDLTPEQAKVMRKAKAERDFKAALDELAVVFANYVDKPKARRHRNKERTVTTISYHRRCQHRFINACLANCE